MAGFRRKLLKNSTGFWPIDGKGKRLCSICRSGIGGNGGLCIFIWGLILGRFPWKGGGWPEGIGGCIGNPWGGCWPGGLCGMGGPAGWPMGTGDPGGGIGGAEGPEVAIPPLCVSSEPPLNWLVPSAWFWEKLEPLKNNVHNYVENETLFRVWFEFGYFSYLRPIFCAKSTVGLTLISKREGIFLPAWPSVGLLWPGVGSNPTPGGGFGSGAIPCFLRSSSSNSSSRAFSSSVLIIW